MEYYVISIRKPLIPNNPNTIGYLFHYGHFILDFALPFYKIYIANKIQTLYLPPDSYIGTMENIFRQLYPEINIKNINSDDIGNPKLIINGYCRLNFHTDFLKETQLFREYVITKAYEYNNSKNWPEIILIERGNVILYQSHTNGSGKRTLKNHKDMVKYLSNQYKSRFENIILENIDFFNQVLYFHNANIVIGQYGSGLVNTLWMKPYSINLQLISKTNNNQHDPVFEKCCKVNNVIQHSIECIMDGKEWIVPLHLVKKQLYKYIK